MSKFTLIRLDAGRDTNGNPKRVFVAFEGNDIVATYDEGYAGLKAVKYAPHRKLAGTACTIKTTPEEYRALIEWTK